jgi:hypothetical protein
MQSLLARVDGAVLLSQEANECQVGGDGQLFRSGGVAAFVEITATDARGLIGH